MAIENSGRRRHPFLGGAAMVFRRQRILWWLFAVNFILAFFSIHGAVPRIGAIMDHSMAAQRLVNRFDLGALAELSLQPGVSPLEFSAGERAYSLVFLVFMVFVTGGILDVYRRDIRFTTSEFFEACGAFFWRFVRLVLWFLLCLIPIAIFAWIFEGVIGGKIENDAISAMTSVWYRLAIAIVIALLVLILRLWFDMAEVHCVAQNERRVRRALRVAWGLTFRNFGALYGMFLGIAILAAIGFGVATWFWMYRLPARDITAAFFLGQAMILFWLAMRLWQRSMETIWYARHFAAETAPATYTSAHYPVITPQPPPSPMPPPSATDAV